jgi:hypothetical protein
MHDIIEILGRREVSIDFEGHRMHTGFMKWCHSLRVSLKAEEGDFE